MNASRIKLASPQKRFLLILPATVLLVAAFFIARQCFAVAVAEQADVKELAQFAVELSPNLPQTHYALASLSEKSFLPEDDRTALQEYEQAVALTPHDFRYWLALGKMRERAGDAEGAEKALRRALELAPAYAQLHWTLGNVLLRQGKIEEAFQEIRVAAEKNPTYAPAAVDAAIRVFGSENPEEITRRAGSSAAARASLIKFLAKDGRFDQALEIWNQLSAEEKLVNKDEATALFAALIEAKRFRLAQALYRENPAIEDAEKPQFEKISNSGFESDRIANPANPLPFAWFLPDGAEPAIGVDPAVQREGGRSLQFAFKTVSGEGFRPVYQTVVIEPGASYRLEFYWRTLGVKSSATVRWDVENTADGKILASSPAVSVGNNDWQRMTIEFVAPARTEAVNIKLARATCSLPPCALVGRIWFDDFSLQKIDGGGKN